MADTRTEVDTSGTSKFKRTAAVIVQTLSFKKATTHYVKFLTEMKDNVIVEKVKDEKGNIVDRDSHATVARVINLVDNNEYDLICPTVMARKFIEDKVDYVGKCFEITASAPREGKRYKDCLIYQIEDTTAKGDAPAKKK